MIHAYQGNYSYNQPTISEWNNNKIGIYYCGFVLQNGNLSPLYIGRATGQDGIKGRLLEHLNNDDWPAVTHFGYRMCDTAKETEDMEASEIATFNPKYNAQGKVPGF